MLSREDGKEGEEWECQLMFKGSSSREKGGCCSRGALSPGPLGWRAQAQRTPRPPWRWGSSRLLQGLPRPRAGAAPPPGGTRAPRRRPSRRRLPQPVPRTPRDRRGGHGQAQADGPFPQRPGPNAAPPKRPEKAGRCIPASCRPPAPAAGAGGGAGPGRPRHLPAGAGGAPLLCAMMNK